MIPNAQTTITKANKWVYTTLKSFCAAKEAINIIKKQLIVRILNHQSSKPILNT
jgi:hypothetical protein